MMRRLAVLLFAGVVLTSGLRAAPAADEFAKPLAKLDLQDGDSLVFLGDSITHQCLYTQYVEDYYLTRFPKARIKFHNSGVGGDRAADALLRFDRDVAHYKPKVVTVLLGMNDGSYMPFDQATFDTYHEGMLELCDRITGIGATPILMHPTMYDARSARKNTTRPATPQRLEFYNSTLAYYGSWLYGVAMDRGFGYVNMYAPLNQLTQKERRTDPEFTLIRDAVHPDAPGQLVMAYALLSDMAVPAGVSNIIITRGEQNAATAKATGGKVSDARFTSDGLEFTFQAASLPLALPEEAQPGAKLLRLGHRLSREALEIHGLPAGRYELLIDGQPVARFASADLERHVELQDNPATPQYQQALAVAMFNKERNDQAVHPLRDLWRDVKVLRVAKARLAGAPDDEAAQKAVAAGEAKIADLEGKITALEAKSQAILDRIYQSNQPPARKYQLVRLQPSAGK